MPPKFYPIGKSIYSAVLFGLSLLLCLQLVGPESFAQQGVMKWSNGDQLKGELNSIDNGNYSWSSDLFSRPLVISKSKLSSIRFEKEKRQASTETEDYLVVTSNRNRFSGKLISVDPKRLVMETKRFGRISLERKQIQSIVNLANSNQAFSLESDFPKLKYPFGDKKHWKRTTEDWVTNSKINAAFGREMTLPETVRFDLNILTERRIDFVLGFGYPKVRSAIEDLMRIEMWEDALVLVHDDGFEPIFESIPEKQKELKLSLFWNRKTSKFIAVDNAGKVLLETDIAASHEKISPGFFVQAKSLLTIKSFSIHKASEKETKSQSDLQLAKSQKNELAGVSAENVTHFDGREWTLNDGGRSKKIPADQLQSIAFASPAKSSNTRQDRITFQDHQVLSGDLLSVRNQQGTIRVPGSRQPISFSIADLLEVQFSANANALAETDQSRSLDRLFSNGRELKGELAAGSGSNDDILRWKPDGAQNDLPLGNGDLRIFLRKKKFNSVKSNQYSHVLFFKNKDVVPCNVMDFQKDKLTIQTFSGIRKIPSSQIHAIEIGQNRRHRFADFLNGDWKVINSDPKATEIGRNFIRTTNRVSFNKTVIGCRKVAFDLTWKGDATFVSKFTNRANRARGDHQLLYLQLSERAIDVSIQNQFQQTTRRIKLKNENFARISMERDQEDRIRFFINNRLVHSGKADFEKKTPVNLQFNVARTSRDMICKISKVRYSSAETTGDPSQIDVDRRKHLLTIPRFRENDPNTHILVAKNGDLLRGRLKSMDNQSVQFSAQEQSFQFDRKKIVSIIWMIPEPKDSIGQKQDREIGQNLQVVFQGEQRLSVVAKRFDGKVLVGENKLLGTCNIPLTQILELRQGKEALNADDFPYAQWYTVHATKPKLEQKSTGGAGEQKSPLLGRVAKPFQLKMLDGSTFKLAENRGKVVVLDFWATWCGPCVNSMPKMIAATKSFQPNEVVFVAVNLMEKSNQISPFIKERNWDIPIGLDSDGKISEAYGASSIPHTVIVGKDGKITFVKTGSSPDLQNLITNQIRQALKK